MYICAWIQVLNSTYALWTWHHNQDAYGENSVGDQIYIVRQPDKCLLQPTSVSSLNWWSDLMIKFLQLCINYYETLSWSLSWLLILNSPHGGCPSPVSSDSSGTSWAVTSGQLFWKMFVIMCVALIWTAEITFYTTITFLDFVIVERQNATCTLLNSVLQGLLILLFVCFIVDLL